MTDQTSDFDDLFGDGDALEKARRNGDGKTIDGEWVAASTAKPDAAKPDANKARKGDTIITGSGPGGPGGFGPQPGADSKDEPKKKSSPFDGGDFANHPFRDRLKKRTLVGHMRDMTLAIYDKGDLFLVGPQQPQGPGQKEMSDKQLRELLIRCVLEKGWNKIYFYNGNKPDFALANRAKIMMGALTRGPTPYINATSLTVAAFNRVTGKKENEGALAGPLYEVAKAWAERQQIKEKEYRHALTEYEMSGGKMPHPGREPNVNLDVVLGRMPIEHLPSYFSRGLHERLGERESKMLRRNHDRTWVKEKFIDMGFK